MWGIAITLYGLAGACSALSVWSVCGRGNHHSLSGNVYRLVTIGLLWPVWWLLLGLHIADARLRERLAGIR